MPKSKENQTQSDTAQLLRNILAEELAPIRQELEEIRRKLGIVNEPPPVEAAPQDKTPPDDHFASARQTKHAAEFFRERGYFITDCQTAAPADRINETGQKDKRTDDKKGFQLRYHGQLPEVFCFLCI